VTRTPIIALTTILLGGLWSLPAVASELQRPEQGSFIRTYWYEPGLEHGTPRFDSRFRVNAPEVVRDPRFMYRSEVRENGVTLIRIDEDLARVTGASLHLELWGGHPGSGEKRVTVNGRSTYVIPDVGSRDHNCTHSYPVIPLKLTDLVNGYNALQFGATASGVTSSSTTPPSTSTSTPTSWRWAWPTSWPESPRPPGRARPCCYASRARTSPASRSCFPAPPSW
jgi:hypothetical protein